MDTRALDAKIRRLRQIEDELRDLTEAKDALRAEVLALVEQAGGETYKNDLATVSAVEHRRVHIEDEQALIRELQAEHDTKYLAVVPEHVELTPAFEEDVKKGYFTHDLVSIEESTSLAVRFHEADEHQARG